MVERSRAFDASATPHNVEGRCWWASDDELADAHVDLGLVRTDSAAFEFRCQDWLYEVQIKRGPSEAGCEYVGSWRADDGRSGLARCKLLLCNGTCLLVGEWDEAGRTFQWWGEFSTTA